MHNSKLRLSFALFSALSLFTVTACDVEPEKAGEESSTGDKAAQKVDKKDTPKGEGTVELRMVNIADVAARVMPEPTKAEPTKAELTVEAIAVRLCVEDDDDDKDDDKDDKKDDKDDDDKDDEKKARNGDPTVEPPAPEPTPEPTPGDQEPPVDPPTDPTLEPTPGQEPGAEPQPEGPGATTPPTDADKPAPGDAPKPGDDGAQDNDEDNDAVESDDDLAEKGDAPNACKNSKWIVLKQDGLKIDLLNLDNMDAGGLLAKGKLPEGTYRGVRMRISKAEIMVGDETVKLFVPSGKTAGLKIRAGFEVEDNGEVDIDLGFDVAGSMRPHRQHGWILKPVLRAKAK